MDFFLTIDDQNLFRFGPSKWWVVFRMERLTRTGRWQCVRSVVNVAEEHAIRTAKLLGRRIIGDPYDTHLISCLTEYAPAVSLTASLYSKWAQANNRQIDMDSLVSHARRAIRVEKQKRRALTQTKGTKRVSEKRRERKRVGDVRRQRLQNVNKP